MQKEQSTTTTVMRQVLKSVTGWLAFYQNEVSRLSVYDVPEVLALRSVAFADK